MKTKIHRLKMHNISKSFYNLKANSNINLDIHEGEILGLLGENGAGKTTLMNILFGLYHPDSGEISINNEPVQFHSPKDAIRHGIGMVHQHFMLVQNHSVAENIVMGFDESPFFFPSRFIIKRIAVFKEKYGLFVNPEEKIWRLSAGEQQRVEIIKALIKGADLLILDEPTSVLTPGEVQQLFLILKKMAGEKHSIIFISHKLEEVLKICTHVTVLRKGSVICHAPVAEVKKRDLALAMVGREIVFDLKREEIKPGKKIIQVRRLHVKGDHGRPAVKGVSFDVHQGEIFAIAGVSGNGQRELLEALTGLRRAESGYISAKGKDITNASARVIADNGIAHIPEERIRFGTVPNLLIYENAVLKKHHTYPFSRVIIMNYKYIKDHTENLINNYNVAAKTIHMPVKNLSGGNIQKLILAREMSHKPDLIIASHPTYGLDIGAAEYIRLQLLEQRKRGSAIILVSESLDEIFKLSDRIAVMYEGEFTGIFPTLKASLEKVGLMMAGSK
jgi:ABC-type uncharacterized transport system ATPase subunit